MACVSSELNLIENLRKDVKTKIARKNLKKFDDLWAGIEEVRHSIPKERCQKLVESMQRRCEELIKNYGFSKKY